MEVLTQRPEEGPLEPSPLEELPRRVVEPLRVVDDADGGGDWTLLQMAMNSPIDPATVKKPVKSQQRKGSGVWKYD